jgi:hypothetical protein
LFFCYKKNKKNYCCLLAALASASTKSIKRLGRRLRQPVRPADGSMPLASRHKHEQTSLLGRFPRLASGLLLLHQRRRDLQSARNETLEAGSPRRVVGRVVRLGGAGRAL